MEINANSAARTRLRTRRRHTAKSDRNCQFVKAPRLDNDCNLGVRQCPFVPGRRALSRTHRYSFANVSEAVFTRCAFVADAQAAKKLARSRRNGRLLAASLSIWERSARDG